MASHEADRGSTTPGPDPAGFLDDARFSQTFTLPSGPGRPHPFRVTYSDYGHRNPDDPSREHVLLFCGPLMGSRFLHVAKDALAKKHGVRVIHPDRPGFGGTTPVSAADRVRVWLEIVPALLRHLGIRHVSVASHSAGAIYALNTLLHLRHILSPARPYAALITPWVHPSRSGVLLMTAASGLPEAVLGKFHALALFSQRNIAPVAGFSSGILNGLTPGLEAVSKLLPSLQTSPAVVEEGERPPVADVSENARMAAFEEAVWKQLIGRVFAESVQGLSEDLILLLKRAAHPEYWGSWKDYDEFVALLAEGERNLGAGVVSDGARLEVEVFWAAEDNLIGTGDGPKWFKDCWGAERRGDRIDFASHIVPGADHDGIVELGFDVMERIFRHVAGTGGDAHSGSSNVAVSSSQGEEAAVRTQVRY
ncbi:interferon-induced gtp-binding protein mx2 [Colletotrichum tabaci]|uniref:Interferon-induced gtp-binding protein mx2 n=1 Tax=Colletotrichum tabaci TaxID=1209068 RepID=A0AAV9TAE0_9PEZI